METEPSPDLIASLTAAQAWWREAGVNLAYLDEPQAWLADERPQQQPAAAAAAVPAPERPRIGGDPAHWPQDLAAFQEWWLTEASLDPGGLSGRIAPRGPVGAPLMVLVPMPEAEDTTRLLSGPHGRLLGNMVTAMGFTPETVYFAAALPRHLPLPDWQGLAAEGLDGVVRHHITLAAPQRLIVLGRDVLSLLGHDLAQAAPAVSQLSILSGNLPLLSSYAPGRLLDHPRLRAELWRRWLDWTGTES